MHALGRGSMRVASCPAEAWFGGKLVWRHEQACRDERCSTHAQLDGRERPAHGRERGQRRALDHALPRQHDEVVVRAGVGDGHHGRNARVARHLQHLRQPEGMF